MNGSSLSHARLLDTLESTRRAEPWRILFYATHGFGKSTAASTPTLGPVFVDLEDGLATIDAQRFPACESTRNLSDIVDALRSEKHEFRTLAVDSVTALERVVFDETARRNGEKTVAEVSYGRGYVEAANTISAILTHLDVLRRDRGMNIILLGHAMIETFADPLVETFDRHVPRLHSKVRPVVTEWTDAVLFGSQRVAITETDQGFSKKRRRGVGAGDRVIYTEERPAFVAKNRFGLPPEISIRSDSENPNEPWSAFWTNIDRHTPRPNGRDNG